MSTQVYLSLFALLGVSEPVSIGKLKILLLFLDILTPPNRDPTDN